jgi:biotin carboxylase
MAQHVVFVEVSTWGAGEKAIEYCIERGYATTVMARDPEHYTGLSVTPDRVLACDTNDDEALLKAAHELHAENRVDGVTTTADFYVPQACIVAEELGLPGMPYRAAAGVRNKYAMRQSLARHCPELNPRFELVHDDEAALRVADHWGFPLIAKPQDANDSWHVLRLGSERELVEYMREAGRWDRNSAGQQFARGVLLESYIEGVEYSVETAQFKGQPIRVLGLTGKELYDFDGHHFVELNHHFPASDPHADAIFDAVSRALTLLEVDCGVIHTECRIHDGDVKILEINPRIAGGMIGSHAIELALGVDAISLVVEAALDNPTPWHPTRQEGAAIWFIPMPETGIFGGIDNLDELRRLPGFAHLKILARVGDCCGTPVRSNSDFVAVLVTHAADADEALERARVAAGRARVRVLDR